MKIKHNIVISLGICLLLLTACSKKEIEEDDIKYSCSADYPSIINTFKEKIKPIGTKSITRREGGTIHISYGIEYDEAEYVRDRDILYTLFYYGDNQFEKHDVKCITFALYEFLNTDSDMKLEIYGVSEQDLEDCYTISKVSGQKVYYFSEFKKNIVEGNAITKVALLAEKQVNISTPVYIDIKDISGGVDYFDYIYMIRTSNDKKLAYCIKSDYSYDITDESAYNSWKEKNADLFVNYTK